MQQDEIKTLWLSLALVEHALAAGARNVLYKPVDMDELIATVEQGCR